MTAGLAAIAPRQVIVFTGHMVDAPERATARFPARLETAAAEHIGAVLDTLRAGPPDLAFTQGAAGGDLLFAEACLARGVPLQLLLPLCEREFLARSVEPSQGGAEWRRRFEAVKARLGRPLLEAPDVLGPLPAAIGEGGDGDAFERGNRWLLDSALAFDGAELHVVCLWDGGAGDGRGGTRHLIETAQSRGARVTWIDTRTLDPAIPPPPVEA